MPIIPPKMPPLEPPPGRYAPLDAGTAREFYAKVKKHGMGGPRPSVSRIAVYMVAGLAGWGSAAKVGKVLESGESISTAGNRKPSRGTPMTVEAVWGLVEYTHKALTVAGAVEDAVKAAASAAAASGEVPEFAEELLALELFPDPNEFRFLCWHALKDAPAWCGDLSAGTIRSIKEIFEEAPVPFNEPSASNPNAGPRVLGGKLPTVTTRSPIDEMTIVNGPKATDIANRTADERAAAERERQKQLDASDPWAYARKVGRYAGYGLGVVGVVVGGPRVIRWAFRMLY